MSGSKRTPTSGATKSKKGIRGYLRDTFSRSSSDLPPSSTLAPRPASGGSVSSGPHNDQLAPTEDTTAVDMSSTRQQSASVQPVAVQDTSNPEHATNPQPIQPVVDTPRTAGAPSVQNVVWTGLRASLQGLRDNPVMFSHLSAAAGILLECFDGIEGAAKNQQDYEDLAKDLVTLSEFIKDHIKPPTPAPMTKSISSVSMEVEQQAKEIKSKVSRNTAGRLVVAKTDEEDAMRRYRRIQSLFRQLQTNLTASVWNIANEQLVNTRLEALNPVKEATYDSKLSSTISRRSCTEGTRIQVLSNLDDWMNNPEMAKVYWMNGMAGTGKTTIAYTFSEQLERHKSLAASFFCTRTTADCKDVSRIIPTLAYQLARYSSPFQTSLYEVLGDDPDAGSRNIRKQFERLLQDPLLKVKDSIPAKLVVVIDALDECEDHIGVETILDTLFRGAQHLPLKFFVTSRPEPEIYNKMSLHSSSREIVHLHGIEKSLVQADIELYLKSELEFMSPTPDEIEQLAQRSGTLFIFAATLVRYIQSGKRLADPKKRLRSVLSMSPEATKQHAQIDLLYTAVLKSALNEDELEKDEVESVRAVLRTVLFAQEPIGVETIAMLAGIDDTQCVVSALPPLRSVLHQSEQTGLVSTLHASFPDFMFNNERSGEYFCDIVEHGQKLAERCFGVMKSQLRFNICDLESSFAPDDEVADIQGRTERSISPALAYACRHTGIVRSLAFSPDGKLVASGSYDHTIRMWNACPLQGHSGIVSSVSFSPDGTRIVSGSWDDTICIWSTSNGALLLGPFSNEHGMVYSVAFSPDGTLIASGSDDHTVRLWHSHDGTPAAPPFEGHTQRVWSVAFTPDGTRLVSGSEDKTIRVWNISDGSLATSPFEGHTEAVYSVAVSPDGMRVASGSLDCTLQIWKIEDGTLAAGPFIGHTNYTTSLSYSPDGTRAISGSYDGTTRVWSVRDRLIPPPAPFQNHLTSLSSISFSGQSHIVSVATDHSIWVWDISGSDINSHSINGRWTTPHLRPMLPAGSNIVASAEDSSFHVLNPSDGSLVAGPFQGHTSLLTASGFSTDSTLLVTSSKDSTIRVWDVQKAASTAGPFRGHQGEINYVELSVDNSRVVSCSIKDKAIRIWSMAGTPLGTALPTKAALLPSAVDSSTPFFEGWKLRADGWVTNRDLALLFWIPPDIAPVSLTPYTEYIITKDGILHVPTWELLIGDQWSKCYISD